MVLCRGYWRVRNFGTGEGELDGGGCCCVNGIIGLGSVTRVGREGGM